MDFIKETFKILDNFAEKFNIEYDPDNKYYSIQKELQKYAIAHDNLVLEDRMSVEDFIISLEVPFIKQNIFKIIYPNTEIEDTVECQELVQNCSLNNLSDSQLLWYLMFIFTTITFNQNNNLVCLKYGIIIYNTGWHNLAKVCRGKIIDLDTKEVVSYPFDKFFNINEVEDTKIEKIKNHIKNANYIFATDKKDGSTIIVSKYKNAPLITTNGSFDNDQIDFAKKLFKTKYKSFLNNLEDGFTYIFEIIYPENRIVIDYGDEEALYLLAVRDLKTQRLLHLNKIHEIANKYGFELPDVYDFKDIDTLINLAHTMKNANKEGWVLRIGNKDNEFMVKIKLDEYFEMHSVFGTVKLGFVYKKHIANELDDFLSICTDEQKKKVYSKLDDINFVREKIKEKAKELAEEILKENNITHKEFCEDKERMVRIINSIPKKDNPYFFFIMRYLKLPVSLDTCVLNIRYPKMKFFFNEFGFNHNE